MMSKQCPFMYGVRGDAPAGQAWYDSIFRQYAAWGVDLVKVDDLSQVTQFLDNHQHPGKDRPSGHFGLAGHNDPVMFRNLSIKSIE